MTQASPSAESNKPKTRLPVVIGGVAIIAASIGYTIYDSHSSQVVIDQPAASVEQKLSSTGQMSGDHQSTIARVPELGNVPESIDVLANEIVANSPNPLEAYSFLVEAKSYRIQELKKRRAKEKAEEEKAKYDAALFKHKIENLGRELELEMDIKRAQLASNSDADVNTTPQYKGNVIPTGNGFAAPKKEKPSLSLKDFRLRAIIQDGNEYKASLAAGQHKLPAKAGYTLLGEFKVVSVLEDSVTLSKGSDRYTLYSY